MPRTSQGNRATTGRRRSTRTGAGSRAVVDQITQIVSANQTLQREVKELTTENARLRSQLQEIGSALGRLTGSRGRGARAALAVAGEARPKRTRKPITDPEQLERRRQALAKARAARSEKLAAARAASASGG